MWSNRDCLTVGLLTFLFAAPTSLVAAEWRFASGEAPERTVRHEESLSFPRGFKATMRFSCDLAALGSEKDRKYGNLFTKGENYKDGFSFLLRNNGTLLIVIKGIEPGYYTHSKMIESGKSCLFEVYVTENAVRTFFDGKEAGSYNYTGKFDFSTKGSLRIGSMPSYPFPGRIDFLKLEDLSEVKVPPGGPKPVLTEPPRRQARAEIKWFKTICREPDRYIGWPTVCRLANGDILAVFSGDREGHICPWGKIQMVRSSDGGETWSAPQTIANGPLDDRDAGIVQLPSGEILVTYFTSLHWLAFAKRSDGLDKSDRRYWWKRHAEKIPKEAMEKGTGLFRIVSKDNGRTWSEPEQYKVSHTPHGPTLLRDGSLFQLGRKYDEKGFSVISGWRSTDVGRTWTCLCDRIVDTNGDNARPHMFAEPHAVELADGTLVGLIRYHGADRCIRSMRSTDGGRTWTPMIKTPMAGMPPHMLVLPDGKIVSVYARRHPDGGFGEFAAISDDGGRSWDVANEILLMPCHNDDLGYPSSCLLPDGSIVTVYYHPEKPGDKPCLMATKWRVTR